MKFGISTACFYPQTPEEAVKFLRENKIEATEIFINSFLELQKDYLYSLKNSLADTEVLSIHPFTCGFEAMLFFSDYERRVDDGLEMYKRYFEACNILGAEILVIHGDRKESSCTLERYCERYSKLFELGKTFGVTVAQENVERAKSGKLKFLTDMKDILNDNVKFVLDLKQARRSVENPLQIIKSLNDSIVHIHISDSNDTEECLLIGEGSTDFDELFTELKNIQYSGGVLLELYRKNFRDYSDLVVSYDKLRMYDK